MYVSGGSGIVLERADDHHGLVGDAVDTVVVGDTDADGDEVDVLGGSVDGWNRDGAVERAEVPLEVVVGMIPDGGDDALEFVGIPLERGGLLLGELLGLRIGPGPRPDS